MRTTIDIPDSLFRKLKKLAVDEGTTLRQLVLDSVQVRLSAPEKKSSSFRLRDASFKGKAGYVKGVDANNWEQMRALIYGDREA